MHSGSPLLVHVKDHIDCGQSIFGEMSDSDSTHYYALNLEPTGYNHVIIDMCDSEVDTSMRLLNTNLKLIDLSVTICKRDTKLPSAGIYIIEISPRSTSYGLYTLRVSCQVPSDSLELLYSLPLSSWTWSDVFDDPDCQNPARQYNGARWCAENTNDPSTYVQADLGGAFIVYSITTEVYIENGEYVESYNLEYSFDGNTFTSYIYNPLIHGYSKSITENVLNPSITAQYLRFVPVEFRNAKAMAFGATGKSYICSSVFCLFTRMSK